MKLTLTKRRKWLIGAGAAVLLTATPSFALFGIGDIVFDPTSYASLVSQLTTLESQYNMLKNNITHFSAKQQWQTTLHALENVNVANMFGETAGIRSVMHLMFECATRWELFTDKRNPIALVRIRDGSKRRQRPAIVTVDQFETIIALLKEPYRTMAYIAQCLGLRVSEIAALQWDDFDFEKNQLLVQRSIVNGNVDDVKTEYSQDYVPLHPSLTEVVSEWSKDAVPTKEGWVFANPITEKPYFPTEIQRRHIRPAGWCLVDCPKCGAGVGVWCSQDKPTPNGARLPIHKERRIAAGKYSSIGWHTFRHTYRSWLDETGAPMKVQQELMRHASIQTTMNVYGQAMSSSKREANGKVVEMVLKPLKASA